MLDLLSSAASLKNRSYNGMKGFETKDGVENVIAVLQLKNNKIADSVILVLGA